MNKEILKQEIEDKYTKFLSSGLSFLDYLEREKKQKLALELKEKSRLEKLKADLLKKFSNKEANKVSCLLFSGKKYESFDQELEYGEIEYKRQRENLFF